MSAKFAYRRGEGYASLYENRGKAAEKAGFEKQKRRSFDRLSIAEQQAVRVDRLTGFLAAE